jgi:hypothetical protein
MPSGLAVICRYFHFGLHKQDSYIYVNYNQYSPFTKQKKNEHFDIVHSKEFILSEIKQTPYQHLMFLAKVNFLNPSNLHPKFKNMYSID